jgi:hypothetical protein
MSLPRAPGVPSTSFAAGEFESLEHVGLRIISFCQTYASGEATCLPYNMHVLVNWSATACRLRRWVRNGQSVGPAQFSVMSPHFQNKVYVHSEQKLRAAITPRVHGGEKEVTEMLEGYGVLLRHSREMMQEDYGVMGGGQAFVHLDDLAVSLAAPTTSMNSL